MKAKIRVKTYAYSKPNIYGYSGGIVYLEERSSNGYVCKGIDWGGWVPRDRLIPLTKKHVKEASDMLVDLKEKTTHLENAIAQMAS